MTNRGKVLPDTDRYSIRRRLGAGGMGVVYEAFDRERNQMVALKTLRWADADAVYRFKREFRSLLDVRHPNLVTLYEMSARDDEWFFTMECVDGVDFLTYVTSGRPDATPDSDERTSSQIHKLRACLTQLAQGLFTLHRAGKVHRDIKPTNVLVTPKGRLVILDFGLSADTGVADPLDITADAMWGTAGYMAPEHGNGPPGPPADWFAVGSMLYHALASRPPFQGGPSTVLYTKWKIGTAPPERPDTLVSGLPSDLVDLCMDLLSLDPQTRPDGLAVLKRLHTAPTQRQQLYVSEPTQTGKLVGRNRELEELRQALNGVQTGRPAAVFLRGPSGIGKTALASTFIKEARQSVDATVLAGRCYPKEAVPDKALDGIIDSLGAYLKHQPYSRVTGLLPDGIGDLVNVFSVLRRVPAIATTLVSETPGGDRTEVRRCAFKALRKLLRRISLSQPLVIYVDDLQRTDHDGVQGLCELFRAPHAPPFLLVACFREGWAGEEDVSRQIERSGADFRRIDLSPLDTLEAINLATVLLPRSGRRHTLASKVCAECAGNPFLIEQMVRHLATSPQASTVGVREIIQARLAATTAGERKLMEIVAAAGHPIDTRLARHAANIGDDERELVGALEIAGFVRTDNSNRVETFHDRIREAILDPVSDSEMADLHRRIADAMRASADPVPELLFEHYLKANKHATASNYAQQAAARAAATYDFERAARLYDKALALRSHSSDSRAQLLCAKATALSAGGRLSEAADTYLDAAVEGTVADQLENRRLGAEHLLLSGRIEEGLREITTVLNAANLSLAHTTFGSLVSLVWSRTKLRARLATRRIRIDGSSSQPTLQRVDVCRSVAEGLAHLEYIRAADFQARHACLALQSGDADRISRALAIEAGFSVLNGDRRGRQRGARLLRHAEAIAARTQSPHALALCTLMAGTIAYFAGNWVRAKELTARAQQQLRAHGSGVAWEVMTSQLYQTLSLYYSGDVPALVTQATTFLEHAEHRGNRFASTIVKTGPANVIWLVRNDPAGARSALTSGLKEWPDEPFRTPHYLALTADLRIRLYEGDGQGALDTVMQQWSKLRSTSLMRIQVIRVIMRHLRATCILSSTTANPRHLRLAKADAVRIRKEGRQWCHGLGLSIEAAIATREGRMSTAVDTLRESVVALERADMTMHAYAARRQLGSLVGGIAGSRMVDKTDTWMTAQGIHDPTRMANMVIPGFIK